MVSSYVDAFDKSVGNLAWDFIYSFNIKIGKCSCSDKVLSPLFVNRFLVFTCLEKYLLAENQNYDMLCCLVWAHRRVEPSNILTYGINCSNQVTNWTGHKKWEVPHESVHTRG